MCKCKDNYEGTRCESYVPPDCRRATSKTGVASLGDSDRYCHAANGGGWELAFNLASNIAPAMWYGADFWTKGANFGELKDGFKVDFKGDAFHKKKNFKVRLTVRDVCVLRACCVLCAACCVLRAACCVL